MKNGELLRLSKKLLNNTQRSSNERQVLKTCTSSHTIQEMLEVLMPLPGKRPFKHGFTGPESFCDKIRKERYPDEKLYWFVPEEYNRQAFGLFIFMHGGDKNSPKTAPENYMKENGFLRPHIDNAPFITVAPSAPSGRNGSRWNQKGTSEYIVAVIEEACSRYNIDRDRIILGGHSMGGFGAYHNAHLLKDRLAGALLSAGAWRVTNFKAFTSLPIYILHGKYDCAGAYREFHKTPRHHSWCGVSYARGAHQLLEDADVEHIYDEHDGGHGLKWEPAQLAFLRFIEWARCQKRDKTPSKVCAVTPCGSGQFCLEDIPHCRWITVNKTGREKIPYDKIKLTGPEIAWTVQEFTEQDYDLEQILRRGGIVEAENLGKNRFEITTQNIHSFSIWLNSGMVDFSKDIDICLNGKRFFRRGKPSLYDTLRNYQRSNDWSNIFSCEIKINVNQQSESDK